MFFSFFSDSWLPILQCCCLDMISIFLNLLRHSLWPIMCQFVLENVSYVSGEKMCLSVFFHGFILRGIFCTSWTLWLFPFSFWGSYQLVSFQIFSQTLSLFYFRYPCNTKIHVWCCPRGFLNYPNLFSFFFLYSVL